MPMLIDPAANLVNDRLATMVGRSSGYVESLSLPVRRRITGLKGLQVAQAEIEAEFQKDIYELEKRYADKYRPLFERRQELVSGRDEPNADEVEKGQQAEDEESEDEDEDEDEDDEEEREEREREGGLWGELRRELWGWERRTRWVRGWTWWIRRWKRWRWWREGWRTWGWVGIQQ